MKGFWYTSCRCRRIERSDACDRPATSSPATEMAPRSGSSSPSSRRMVVVFPEPDSPTNACVVPVGTLNDTSSTAVSLRPSTVNDLVTPVTSILGGPPAGSRSRRCR